MRAIRALVLALVVMAWLGAGGPTVAGAAPEGWARSYPERQSDGCLYVVAEFQGPRWTQVPIECPAGVMPQRDGRPTPFVRAYPEADPDGCEYVVAAWADGRYTRVPVRCTAAGSSATPPAPSTASAFQGTGRTATGEFDLSVGWVIVIGTHQGRSNFIVDLVDAGSGRTAGLAANVIGSYQGSRAVYVRQNGRHLLQVRSADGPWSLRPVTLGELPVLAPGAITGRGDAVFAVDVRAGRLDSQSVSRNGRSNFIVELNTATGSSSLLANEIGPSQSSRVTNVARAGVHLLEVTHDGEWTITLTQP